VRRALDCLYNLLIIQVLGVRKAVAVYRLINQTALGKNQRLLQNSHETRSSDSMMHSPLDVLWVMSRSYRITLLPSLFNDHGYSGENI
jgi:hypothetical protein